MKITRTRFGSLLVALAMAACTNSRERRSTPDTPRVMPDAHSAQRDSAELERFRSTVGPPPQHLDGYRDRTLLVRAFASAVASRDTLQLRRLALTRNEFAWLYYPDAPLARPPYELDPETMWTEIAARSLRGYTRTMNTYGGTLHFIGYACEPTPQRSGALTLWNACTVTHEESGTRRTEQLFGTIVERDGWFKFVGLSNRL